MENLAEKKVQNDSEYISVEKSEDNYNSTLNPEETDFNINTNYIENDIYLNYDQQRLTDLDFDKIQQYEEVVSDIKLFQIQNDNNFDNPFVTTDINNQLAQSNPFYMLGDAENGGVGQLDEDEDDFFN